MLKLIWFLQPVPPKWVLSLKISKIVPHFLSNFEYFFKSQNYIGENTNICYNFAVGGYLTLAANFFLVPPSSVFVPNVRLCPWWGLKIVLENKQPSPKISWKKPEYWATESGWLLQLCHRIIQWISHGGVPFFIFYKKVLFYTKPMQTLKNCEKCILRLITTPLPLPEYYRCTPSRRP